MNEGSLPSIHFKLVYGITDRLLKDYIKEDFEWRGKSSDIQLGLEKATPAPGQVQLWTISAMVTRELPPALSEAFQDLSNGRLPPGSDCKIAEASLDESGHLKPRHVPPLEALPKPFQDYCTGVYDDLDLEITEAIDLLRWRAGLVSGKPRVFTVRGLRFSLDGGTWQPVPHNLKLMISFDFPVSKRGLTSDIINAVTKLQVEGYSEPLCHQLFREAWSLRQSTPAASLAIGYTSIEVGCKEFMSNLVPLVAWLATEVPSPPIDRILKNYLPLLPARLKINDRVSIPQRILKIVRDATEMRNKLIHRGKLDISAETLERMLRAFNDLLWLFDFHAGHDWAWQQISAETQKELST